MKTIAVVAISTEFKNARKVCGLIESQGFESYQELRDYLTELLEIKKDYDQQPQFFTLTDFMDECNDQLFDIEKNFISYVTILLKN